MILDLTEMFISPDMLLQATQQRMSQSASSALISVTSFNFSTCPTSKPNVASYKDKVFQKTLQLILCITYKHLNHTFDIEPR